MYATGSHQQEYVHRVGGAPFRKEERDGQYILWVKREKKIFLVLDRFTLDSDHPSPTVFPFLLLSFSFIWKGFLTWKNGRCGGSTIWRWQESEEGEESDHQEEPDGWGRNDPYDHYGRRGILFNVWRAGRPSGSYQRASRVLSLLLICQHDIIISYLMMMSCRHPITSVLLRLIIVKVKRNPEEFSRARVPCVGHSFLFHVAALGSSIPISHF